MTVESFLDSGFFGAILGGAGTLLASRLEIHSEAKKEKIKKIEEFIRISGAIKHEFRCAWTMFNVNIGREISELSSDFNNFLRISYKIDSDYFPIYNGNTNVIGSFDDEKLIENIISLHINALALIDSIKLYTESYQLYLKTYKTMNEDELKNKEYELIEQGKFIYGVYSYINYLTDNVDDGIKEQIESKENKLNSIMKEKYLFGFINKFFSKSTSGIK